MYPERLVIVAEHIRAKALELGEPSKEHVLNCLSRLEQSSLPQPLKTPPALKPVTEPLANTARYDDLRRARHER